MNIGCLSPQAMITKSGAKLKKVIEKVPFGDTIATVKKYVFTFPENSLLRQAGIDEIVRLTIPGQQSVIYATQRQSVSNWHTGPVIARGIENVKKVIIAAIKGVKNPIEKLYSKVRG